MYRAKVKCISYIQIQRNKRRRKTNYTQWCMVDSTNEQINTNQNICTAYIHIHNTQINDINVLLVNMLVEPPFFCRTMSNYRSLLYLLIRLGQFLGRNKNLSSDFAELLKIPNHHIDTNLIQFFSKMCANTAYTYFGGPWNKFYRPEPYSIMYSKLRSGAEGSHILSLSFGLRPSRRLPQHLNLN